LYRYVKSSSLPSYENGVVGNKVGVDTASVGGSFNDERGGGFNDSVFSDKSGVAFKAAASGGDFNDETIGGGGGGLRSSSSEDTAKVGFGGDFNDAQANVVVEVADAVESVGTAKLGGRGRTGRGTINSESSSLSNPVVLSPAVVLVAMGNLGGVADMSVLAFEAKEQR
jgi:hypothetical protein